MRQYANVSGAILFFHAHPDDEALLTAGTMARANAEGQRVILVTATAGEAGLADESRGSGLGSRRIHELQRSGRILGAARIELLGYADSGIDGDSAVGGATAFCQVPVADVAARLAAIIAEEGVHTLVTYDASGGYGHPDHVHVHRCGVAAAQLSGLDRVFAATAPREPFAFGVHVADRFAELPPGTVPQFENAYTPSGQITHRVDVRDYCDFKRAAMAAHASQATGGDIRTLGVLLKLPRPLYRRILGTEYYRRLPV
ncbi:MAG: PIG-L family deacetylase [Actinobacteria bacterium]|nr:PIG-L family deacetylase [Actinomycetota bacterium]